MLLLFFFFKQKTAYEMRISDCSSDVFSSDLISLSITNHATAQPYGQRSESRMILAVGNTKGGVGKTTLAVNLAVARALAGRDLLLVDGDEQGTALTFTELRADRLGQAGYTAVALTGAALRSQVRQLAAKY